MAETVSAAAVRAWVGSRRWLIRPEALGRLLDAGDVSREPRVEASGLVAAQGEAVLNLPDWIDRDWFKGVRIDALGVAHISVHGPIYSQGSFIARLMASTYGGHVLELAAAMIEQVAARPEVRAVLLDVDSPGGEGAGGSDYAAMLQRIDAGKPVYAFVSGMMCSAGYHIASSARRIWAAPDAWIGSIGAVMVFLDTREAMERAGLREIVFINEQSPYKWADPASPVGEAEYQGWVNASAAQFIADVAAHRGVSADTVEAEFGGGSVFIAAEALRRGMIDAVGHKPAAYAALLAELAPAVEADPPAAESESESEPVEQSAEASEAAVEVEAAQVAPAPLRDAVARSVAKMRAADRRSWAERMGRSIP